MLVQAAATAGEPGWTEAREMHKLRARIASARRIVLLLCLAAVVFLASLVYAVIVVLNLAV